LLFIVAGVIAWGCNQANGKKPEKLVLTEDSMNFYPPTPGKLPRHEFRRYYNQATAYFDSVLVHRGFNGSYLIAKDGEIIVEKYIGFADAATKADSLTEHSAFHLASVSKTFTAMAILKLWQDGKLALEDDISKYFEQFPYPGVTVKMLLNHRSGLPNYVHYLEQLGWNRKKTVTNQDVLNSLYTMNPPLQFATGKHFGYCNTNYALLALLIEKLSGTTYANYLQQTFFTPMGMKDTYVYAQKDSATAMPSFEHNNRRFAIEYLDVVYGDKNIYSTVKDMLKWDQALYAQTLFTRPTLDSAFAPYSFEKDGKRNYGLGWRMTLLENGKKIIYHNGWWHGNNTVFIRLIDEKATIIVLGNKFNRNIYKSVKLADIFGNYSQRTPNPEEGAETDASVKDNSGGSPR
jgi:CubicO group peptidase (beta-lactamase class C family)